MALHLTVVRLSQRCEEMHDGNTKDLIVTMVNSAIGAMLVGGVVTYAADRFTAAGTPNAAGIVAAVFGGLAAGLATIRKLTADQRRDS